MHDISVAMGGRYPAEAALAEELHWTLDQIEAQPNDFIDELLTRRRARSKWEQQRYELDRAKRT